MTVRRFVVFDPAWLYETARDEDFRHGLGNVSHFLYVKGPVGGARGWAGHCTWNRVPGARMVFDPDLPADQREVVKLVRRRDDDLVSDLPGLVWNFPAARKGRFGLSYLHLQLLSEKEDLKGVFFRRLHKE